MVFRYISPLHPVHQLRREMDRIWSTVMGENKEPPWSGIVRGQPAVNVWETDEALFAELETPGLKSDQLNISVIGDQLTIKVERPEVEEGKLTYHRRERPVGAFTRVLRLPVAVEGDRVEAELQNGVLTVRLPKAAAARPRKIQVVTK